MDRQEHGAWQGSFRGYGLFSGGVVHRTLMGGEYGILPRSHR